MLDKFIGYFMRVTEKSVGIDPVRREAYREAGEHGASFFKEKIDNAELKVTYMKRAIESERAINKMAIETLQTWFAQEIAEKSFDIAKMRAKMAKPAPTQPPAPQPDSV